MKFIILVALAWLLPASISHAWKLDTHYWLGKEVLKELDASKGFVSIPSKLSYQIPPALHQAISKNRGDYLLGVLGPDAYPDMVAGQMTTHPGLKRGEAIKPPALSLLQLTGRTLSDNENNWWATDDWLKFVRNQALVAAPGSPVSDRNIAFAYGYLSHAAMDMWAHSYVNLYSGDIFSMIDEQEVEFRHMAIENLVKRTHQNIFKASSPITQEEAARQLEQGIEMLRSGLGTNPSPGTVLESLPSSSLTSPRVDELSRYHAPLKFVRNTLVLNRRVANQYARETTTLHLFAMYLYWAEVNDLDQRLKDSIDSMATEAQRKVTEAKGLCDAADRAVKAAATSLENLRKLLADAERNVTAAENTLQNAIQTARNTFNLDNDDIANWPDPAKEAIRFPENVLRDQKNSRNKWKRLLENYNKTLDEWDAAKQARVAVADVRTRSQNLITGPLDAWREGIEDAIDAYLDAWEETAKEIMRPPGTRFSPGGDVTAPLKQWVQCWGPTFGLPIFTQIAPACHKALSAYTTLTQNIPNLFINLVIPDFLKEPIENFDKSVHRTVDVLVPKVAQMVSDTIRIDNGAIAGYTRSIINLRSKEPTLDEIDQDFANDISQKRLVTFPQKFTDLLYQDMGLKPGSEGQSLTQLQDFAALQNSFTMSKLVLLDGADLNRLTISTKPNAAHRNVREKLFPPPPPTTPYDVTALAGEILIGALRSIDGDHQWQKRAPKLPRRTRIACPPPPRADEEHEKYCSDRTFGYDASDEGKGGLKLWQDPELRKDVFNKIFQGPLTPGLVAALREKNVPIEQGIGTCADDPFPPTNPPVSWLDRCDNMRPKLNLGSRPPLGKMPLPSPGGQQKPNLR